jgi:pimeloyl-ACP methyl ester carboxylesterase
MLTLVAALCTATPGESWKQTPLPGKAPTPDAQGRVASKGSSLYWASFGHGEPLLLLHGGAGNSDHWANQLAAFAEQFRVIVVDSRGHGRSTRDQQPLSYALMADDVVAVMDALGLARASVVGWSDGGIIGLDLAIRYPGRVQKLVAYAANATLAGLQRGGGAAFDAYLVRCATDYAALSPTPKDFEGLMRLLRPMWHSQPNYSDAQLASIAAPTLVLAGEHDELIRQDHLRHLASVIPHATLVLVPNASHFALFQQPAAFNRAVLAFLRAP